MSEDYSSFIKYEHIFDSKIIERVLWALASAVGDNWRHVGDKWSIPEPKHKVDIECWAERCTQDRMIESEFNGHPFWFTDDLRFSFSPLSHLAAGFALIKSHDGALACQVTVSSKLLYERQGDRQRDRMECEWDEIRKQRGEDSTGKIGPDYNHPDYDAWNELYLNLEDTPNVWPQNKACLVHIIANLCAVFLVREVSIDEPLRGKVADHESYKPG